jgi:hypothetical protein
LLVAACDDPARATIINDTSEPVTVKQCDADCYKTHRTEVLLPGDDTGTNTSSRVVNWWQVVGADGSERGCIALRATSSTERLRANVSTLEACPPKDPLPYWQRQLIVYLIVSVPIGGTGLIVLGAVLLFGHSHRPDEGPSQAPATEFTPDRDG